MGILALSASFGLAMYDKTVPSSILGGGGIVALVALVAAFLRGPGKGSSKPGR